MKAHTAAPAYLRLAVGLVLTVASVPAAPVQDALEPSGPGPRSSHALVFHDGLQRVVLLTGGRDLAREEIWAWDGSLWAVLPGSGPPARSQSAAAYDARRGRLVLHGGVDARGASQGDTWEWDGERWRESTGATAGVRDHHAMAHDERRGVTVLYGGLHRPTQDRESWEWVTEVREWDGTSWSTKAAPGPGPRIAFSLVYDAARGQVVLFGGGDPEGNGHADTWAWDGNGWVRLDVGGPAARRGHATAYDGDTGTILLYGGIGGAGSLGDFWRWDGRRWAEVPLTGPTPGSRFGHAMAYDAARGRTVLHGGFRDGEVVGDTWEWDGRRWAEIR